MAPAIIMPQPDVSSVILASTGDFELDPARPADAASEHLGLETIKEALITEGFKDAVILKPHASRPYDLSGGSSAVVDAFRSAGAAESGAVMGISTTSSRYHVLAVLSPLLRRAFPGVQIVLGGAHVVRERIAGFADPVEAALGMGLADAAVCGHAQGFVDLVVKHRGRREDVTTPGFYQLDPVYHKVVGRGTGFYPRVGRLPSSGDAGEGEVITMLADQCRNGCDFCFITGRRPPNLTVDIVACGLGAMLREGVHTFSLTDSNPFLPHLDDFYREIFDRIEGEDRSLKAVYLDPSALLKNFYRVVERAERYGCWYFYAGRDAVLEEDARVIGTKYLGKIKDQHTLDEEKTALRNFIGAMLLRRRKASAAVPRKLTLSYITTPFMTRDSALAMLDDMREFLDLSTPEMEVGLSVQALMPYPGTALRARLADAIDLEDFDFDRDDGVGISPWKRDACPSLRFMREVTHRDAPMRLDDYLPHFEDAILRYLPR